MTAIRLALGRILDVVALRLLEPRDDEPWDPERSLCIDRLTALLERSE